MSYLAAAAAAAAKSLQSCLTLCNPIDGSPPSSPIPGILQARTLEWVAISFSNAWKWKVKVKSLSRVRPSATPWTAALQAPPSMRFSLQEYWSGVPLPSPHIQLTRFNKIFLLFHAKKRHLIFLRILKSIYQSTNDKKYNRGKNNLCQILKCLLKSLFNLNTFRYNIFILLILIWTWNNRLFPNRKRSTSRLHIITLLI